MNYARTSVGSGNVGEWERGVMNYARTYRVGGNVGEWGTFHDRDCSGHADMYGHNSLHPFPTAHCSSSLDNVHNEGTFHNHESCPNATLYGS